MALDKDLGATRTSSRSSRGSKRPDPPEHINAANPKRWKRGVEDDLLCAITLELPFEPVTAEDGRVYERKAIETYFESKPGDQVKSPITREMIGKRLLPAPQHKNTIETLIEKGLMPVDLARKWKETEEAKKERGNLFKCARKGNVKAMEILATRYHTGRMYGFEKVDHEAAYFWYNKARLAGSLVGMSMQGVMLAYGLGCGTAANPSAGVIYLTHAAEKGCGFAALNLGKALAGGHFGLAINNHAASKWLQKAANATSVLSPDFAAMARQKLKEVKLRLTGAQAGTRCNSSIVNSSPAASQMVVQKARTGAARRRQAQARSSS